MNAKGEDAMREVGVQRPGVWRRAAPALTLIVLAPLIAEVLSGSTRLSFLFVFIPEMMVWGCGALIAREMVRRWRGGGASLVLLGLALAVAEEWVIQQTSLAPLPWVKHIYGRMGGVNWIWFLFFLGYECVWVVLVPVVVTELIYTKRRSERWLSNGGLVASGGVFVAGSVIAWFLWTHIARPKTLHVAIYQPPAMQIGLGVLMIAALAMAAYALRGVGSGERAERWIPPVWGAGVAAVLLGVPWYGLMTLIFGGKTMGPFWAPMVVGVAWAAIVWAVIRRWTAARGWGDRHRWALAFGATVVVMGCGFLGSGSWPRMDLVAKAMLNALAVAGFVMLGVRLRRNTAASD
ncbi:MAG TPA: hypothetical protein VFE06_15405 [Acidobacteriaceae bacterium]|jgi:hypothetical protein|nr:hypothetical protein [Acidobacteriaceae bacterium]